MPGPRRTSLDVGRLVMVPLMALILLIDIRALVAKGSAAASGGFGAVTVLQVLGTALVCSFYALIIWGYLRRVPAVATTRSLAASGVAVVATFVPFLFPLLSSRVPGVGWQLAADALLVCGTAWSVWSVRSLGRNLSLIAQARGVAERGPYRFVQHPLYTGELTSALGLTLLVGTWGAFALWCVFLTMQVYRAQREEQVLLLALPGYRDYRARTAALVPGLSWRSVGSAGQVDGEDDGVGGRPLSPSAPAPLINVPFTRNIRTDVPFTRAGRSRTET